MGLTQQQASQLKNGQHILVRIKRRYVDALFIEHHHEYGVYAHYMGIDRILGNHSGIYGTQNWFDLNEIQIPKEVR